MFSSGIMRIFSCCSFFFNDTATTEIYTLSLHDALPIRLRTRENHSSSCGGSTGSTTTRSEEHTSELQSRRDLVCRLLLEKKKDSELKLDAEKATLVSHVLLAERYRL